MASKGLNIYGAKKNIKKVDTRNAYECSVTGMTCMARTLSKARKQLGSGSVKMVKRWFGAKPLPR